MTKREKKLAEKKAKELIKEIRQETLWAYYLLGQIDGLIKRRRFLDKLKY